VIAVGSPPRPLPAVSGSETTRRAAPAGLRLLGVFAFFVLVGVVYAYPLVPHFFSGLPYTHAPHPGAEVVQRFPGDYLQLYYHLWLLQDGLFGPTPLFTDPYEFQWGGPQPGWKTYFLPTSLLFVALAPLGTLAAYNGFVLLSFGLSGLAMFLLTREVVGPGWPAVLAGLVFALAPYRHAVLMGGHPAGSAFYLVPLVFLGLERAIRTGRAGGSLLAGLAALSLALVEPHYFYFLTLVLPVFLLVRMLPGWREMSRPASFPDTVHVAGSALRPLWPLALSMLAGVGAMLMLKRAALDALGRSGRTLREIGLFAPTAQDWLPRLNEYSVRNLYPGIVALLLLAVGLAGLTRLESRARRWASFAIALFIVAEVLSLGPNAPVPLYAWLYDLVPYFAFVRQSSKFQVLAFLALALLAGLGLRTLLGWLGDRPRWASVATGLCLVAVAFDYWPARPVGVSLLRVQNRVYDVLATSSGAAIYVPIWPGESAPSSLYQFATTLTRRPMVNGYSPVVSRRYVEEVYRPLEHLNRGELTEQEHRRLRTLGVRFVVLDPGAFPSKVSPFPSSFTRYRLSRSPYLEELAEDPPLSLYALRDAPADPPAPLLTHPFGIFFEAERLPRQRGGVVETPEASWGRVARAEERAGAEGPGYLVLGAKAPLPRGSFRMIFRLRARGAPGAALARIDAMTEGGARTLASRALRSEDVSGAYEDHILAFSLDRGEWVEFRVFWEGRGQLEVDYLYGMFADQPDPRWVFRNTEFDFGYGPYRRYPPGDYEVRFRARVGRRDDAPVLRLAVVTAHERAPLATRLVRGTDLVAAGVYQEITLPMRLPALRVLEFLIEFLAPGLSVDQISVVPRS
jgi:Bacterial membrane protein YfhO